MSLALMNTSIMKGTAIARLCERERGDQLAIGHAYGSMAMVDYGGLCIVPAAHLRLP